MAGGRPGRAAASRHPFRELGRRSLEAVLDMLSGRYASEEFGELRPRIVRDRVNGTVRGRAGAQRLAVTNPGNSFRIDRVERRRQLRDDTTEEGCAVAMRRAAEMLPEWAGSLASIPSAPAIRAADPQGRAGAPQRSRLRHDVLRSAALATTAADST